MRVFLLPSTKAICAITAAAASFDISGMSERSVRPRGIIAIAFWSKKPAFSGAILGAKVEFFRAKVTLFGAKVDFY